MTVEEDIFECYHQYSFIAGDGEGPHPTEEDLTVTSHEASPVPLTPTEGTAPTNFSIATSASQAVSTSTVKSNVIGDDEERIYRAAAMSFHLNDVT